MQAVVSNSKEEENDSLIADESGMEDEPEGFLRLSPPLDQQHSVLDQTVSPAR